MICWILKKKRKMKMLTENEVVSVERKAEPKAEKVASNHSGKEKNHI
jgi:hypothetical protein